MAVIPPVAPNIAPIYVKINVPKTTTPGSAPAFGKGAPRTKAGFYPCSLQSNVRERDILKHTMLPFHSKMQ